MSLDSTGVDLLFSFEAKVNEKGKRRKKKIAFGYVYVCITTLAMNNGCVLNRWHMILFKMKRIDQMLIDHIFIEINDS